MRFFVSTQQVSLGAQTIAKLTFDKNPDYKAIIAIIFRFFGYVFRVQNKNIILDMCDKEQNSPQKL
jgi:hypothetical protein